MNVNTIKYAVYVILILILTHTTVVFSADPVLPTNTTTTSSSEQQEAFIKPLCNVVNAVSGKWGKALLVLGAIFVGVNVFIGKFSFTMLIGFIAAGALILSPQAIISILSSGKDKVCQD